MCGELHNLVLLPCKANTVMLVSKILYNLSVYQCVVIDWVLQGSLKYFSYPLLSSSGKLSVTLL